MLYMERRLPPRLGEFSVAILINAIYRNTKQMLVRENMRLSSWTPTALVQPRVDRPCEDIGWLPASPTASKWRNSACDCLDLLHWSANSKAAQLSGSEHHTILQLHLSRLIILTPTSDIQIFATSSTSLSETTDGNKISPSHAYSRKQVLDWVVRDRFKARLSLVHCGALYWHVRRYSCDSALEPFAIYIATLILWAFCVASNFISQGNLGSIQNCEQTPGSIWDESDEDPEPSFLHLDRPLDDELVQTFVRSGHKMSAYVAKVGDIRDLDAPAKILREGICLLGKGSHPISSEPHRQDHPGYTWGIELSYATALERLLRTDTPESRVNKA
jgi:hypothetical protein